MRSLSSATLNLVKPAANASRRVRSELTGRESLMPALGSARHVAGVGQSFTTGDGGGLATSSNQSAFLPDLGVSHHQGAIHLGCPAPVRCGELLKAIQHRRHHCNRTIGEVLERVTRHLFGIVGLILTSYTMPKRTIAGVLVEPTTTCSTSTPLCLFPTRGLRRRSEKTPSHRHKGSRSDCQHSPQQSR